MKHRIFAGLALAGCLAMSVAGCATVSAVISPIDQGKAVASAIAGVDAASISLSAAARSGVLKGQAAGSAKVDLHAAQVALEALKAAYAAGDASTTATQLIAVTNLLVAVNSLLKPPG